MLWLFGEGGQEVGVDVGQDDHADAFDAHYHVLVLIYPLDVAFVAFVDASGDPYAFFDLEFPGGVDCASGGVVGRQETQEVYGALWNDLYVSGVWVAVYPHGYGSGLRASAGGLERDGVLMRGLYEQEMWNHGPEACLASGLSHGLFQEKDLVAEPGEDFFRVQILSGPYREPYRLS